MSTPVKSEVNTYIPGKSKLTTFIVPRDGEAPFKFKGEKIGEASRTFENNDGDEVKNTLSLFKTCGGNFVVQVETVNNTEDGWCSRRGYKAESIEAFVETLLGMDWDKDILFELFEHTDADSLTEDID